MTTYLIKESTHVNDKREMQQINASSLNVAKRKAQMMQCFYGTVISIWDGDRLLAETDSKGRWY